MRLLALILVCGTLGSGCTYSAPKLRVTEARLSETTREGYVVIIKVEAENRNSVELPLREMKYSVTMNGDSFTGVRSPQATLRRLGIQTISFPAVFALAPGAAPPTGAVNCTVSGDLGYITPGEFAQVLFDTGARRPSVSFSGQVPLTNP